MSTKPTFSPFKISAVTVGSTERDTPVEWMFRTFSAGEVQVRIVDTDLILCCDHVRIEGNPTSTQAIMVLFNLINAIQEINSTLYISLHLHYLPYSRQDRVCYPGESFALSVFLTALTALLENGSGWELVTYDVHSAIAARILSDWGWSSETFVNIPAWKLLKNATNLDQYTYVVAPDMGARGRATDVIRLGKIGHTLIQMDKVREPETGKLSGFKIVESDAALRAMDKSMPILLVDDICDGGRTFIGVAKALREAGFTGRITLYVTHGIFSAGFADLLEHFNSVLVANVLTDQPLPNRVVQLERA